MDRNARRHQAAYLGWCHIHGLKAASTRNLYWYAAQVSPQAQRALLAVHPTGLVDPKKMWNNFNELNVHGQGGPDPKHHEKQHAPHYDVQPGESLDEYYARSAMRKGAPFAGYDDFDDCTSQNSDKGDSDAYCGEIKHRTEDKKESRRQSVNIFERGEARRKHKKHRDDPDKDKVKPEPKDDPAFWPMVAKHRNSADVTAPPLQPPSPNPAAGGLPGLPMSPRNPGGSAGGQGTGGGQTYIPPNWATSAPGPYQKPTGIDPDTGSAASNQTKPPEAWGSSPIPGPTAPPHMGGRRKQAWPGRGKGRGKSAPKKPIELMTNEELQADLPADWGPAIPSSDTGEGLTFNWPTERQGRHVTSWSGWGPAQFPKAREVTGWKWDSHLDGYVSNSPQRFACECGNNFSTPSGFQRCACGKQWNSYIIGGYGHNREASADKYLVREIPGRPEGNVIVAAREPGDGTINPQQVDEIRNWMSQRHGHGGDALDEVHDITGKPVRYYEQLDAEDHAKIKHHLFGRRLVVLRDPRTGKLHKLIDPGEVDDSDGEDPGHSTFKKPPRDWAHRGDGAKWRKRTFGGGR